MLASVTNPDTLWTEFSYPAIPSVPLPDMEGLAIDRIETGVSDEGKSVDTDEQGDADKALWQQRIAEEAARSYEAGRVQGYEQGRAAEREAAVVKGQSKTREDRAALVENFTRAQAQYFEAMEPELVRLALSIANRILRQEAHIDPLLLTGTVRAALGQIGSASRVRLMVPPEDLDLWSESIAVLPNLPVKPTVAAGEGLKLGDCRLESELGSADLGIDAQLEELGHALFGLSSQGLPEAAGSPRPAETL